MWYKFPYNENFVALAKKHAGGNGNLMINFAWPYVSYHFLSVSCQQATTVTNVLHGLA